MRNCIFILILVISGCKSSEKYDYKIKVNKYSTTYQFENSKSVIFSDSLTKEWFVGRSNRTAVAPTITEIIAVNKKLEKDYVKFFKEGNDLILYDSMPNGEHFKNEAKKNITRLKVVQSRMRKLDKQFACYIDSLGQKIIVVKVISSEERPINIEKYWDGMITLKYNVKDSKFIYE